MTYIQPTENSPSPPRRRRFAMIAAAAAVVLVVGALVFATRGNDEGQEVPATVPPTVPSPSTTVATSTTRPPSAAEPPADDPIGQATDFLTAFSTGDAAAVSALQSDAFLMRQAWPGEPFGDGTADFEWLGMSYQVGSAAKYVDPTCSPVTDVDGVVAVQCETAMELALHRLTNTEPLGATVTVTVGNDGVVAMDSAYATSFGFDLLQPFEDWRDENRPGALPDDDPQTAAESLEYARTEAALVADWVTWATAAVEDAFADHNAGDLDAFLARFNQSAAILGIESTDAREVFSASAAGGQHFETSNCSADGIDRGLAIVCDVVVTPPGGERSGIEASGTIRMIVTPDGTVLSNRYEVDTVPIDDFNVAFEQWLLATHPDVHAQVTWIDVRDSRIPSADDQAVVAPYYDEFVAQSEVYPLGR